jgi:mycothiol system anti-sigma-R factor
MNQGESKNPTNDSCNCMDMVQLVLDGEASQEEIIFFNDHLRQCKTCANNYSVDATIQHLIKSTCCGSQPPEDLVNKIRSRLNRMD